MKITEHNAETNEVIERDMTAEELTAFEAMRESLDSDAKAKADQKAALLDRLGITAEEAALLLG